jgi:hypothetical protein
MVGVVLELQQQMDVPATDDPPRVCVPQFSKISDDVSINKAVE